MVENFALAQLHPLQVASSKFLPYVWKLRTELEKYAPDRGGGGLWFLRFIPLFSSWPHKNFCFSHYTHTHTHPPPRLHPWRRWFSLLYVQVVIFLTCACSSLHAPLDNTKTNKKKSWSLILEDKSLNQEKLLGMQMGTSCPILREVPTLKNWNLISVPNINRNQNRVLGT